jgi:toxin ParE1/3/4
MLFMQCILSTFAELDLEEIADYIARDNPRRALSYIGEIREHCRNIVTFPEAAPLREEFGPGIRVIPFGRYLVFYTAHPGTVRIERILFRARQHPGNTLTRSTDPQALLPPSAASIIHRTLR